MGPKKSSIKGPNELSKSTQKGRLEAQMTLLGLIGDQVGSKG